MGGGVRSTHAVTLDTDTTVHTLFGHQMGARKGYNPKNKGKKSYQPILTLLAETREYIAGELHNGDRPSDAQVARHLENVFAALPQSVSTIYARADSGFYCGEAVGAYESQGCQFILSARKTAPLVDELKGADWKGSPRTDADGQCEFSQSDGAKPRGRSRADCQRSSGFLAGHVATTRSNMGGAKGRTLETGGGSRSRMAAIRLARLLASKALRPVAIS